MELSDKNLLIVTSGFPNNLNIYEGVFVREQVLFLQKSFNNIYVIRPQYFVNPKLDIFNILPKSWKEKSMRENYDIGNIKVFFPKVSIFQPFKNWQIKKFIEKKNLKFDLIHSHFIYPSGEIGNYLKKEFNVKHICTAHGFDVYDLPFRNFFWNYKVKNILKKIDTVVTVSETNIKCLHKLGVNDNKINFIQNGYNNDKFYILNKNKLELKSKIGLPKDKKILINVGNLLPIKDQEYLIDTFYELNKIRNDLYLIIIGEGFLKEKLQSKINELELNNNIKLLLAIENDKLINYYTASDLFILTSKSESTGIVVLEAGACGLFSVIIKNGGTENYINNEVGIILDNKKDLLAGIKKGLDNKKDKIKIAKFSRDNYSLENLTKNLMKEYEELLK